MEEMSEGKSRIVCRSLANCQGKASGERAPISMVYSDTRGVRWAV